MYKLGWDEREDGLTEQKVTFSPSKLERKRQHAVVGRDKVVKSTEEAGSGEETGALEIKADVLDVHPELRSDAPITHAVGEAGGLSGGIAIRSDESLERRGQRET